MYRTPSVATVPPVDLAALWDAQSKQQVNTLGAAEQKDVDNIPDFDLFKTEFKRIQSSAGVSQRAPSFTLSQLPDRLLEWEQLVQKELHGNARLAALWGLILVSIKRVKTLYRVPVNSTTLQSRSTTSEQRDLLRLLSRILGSIEKNLDTLTKRVASIRKLESGMTSLYESMLELFARVIIISSQGIQYALSEWKSVEKPSQVVEKGFKDIFDAQEQNDNLGSGRDSASSICIPVITTDKPSVPKQQEVHTVLLPAQNIRFSGREDVLEQIDKELDFFQNPTSLKVCVIHGLAGVGKTEIARAYAYKAESYCDAVFWMSCDSSITMSEAFTNAALRLELPGASPSEHRKNVHLMANWLSKTTQRWLWIFNNVDDTSLLTEFWPSVGRGFIIITARGLSPFTNFSESFINIKPLTEDEGAKCLAKLIGKDLLQGSDELEAAKLLSARLGGHCLGLSLMAARIRIGPMSIRKGLDQYESYKRQLHLSREREQNSNMDDRNRHDLTTLWTSQFNLLGQASKSLLGLIMFLSPDDIPEAIFQIASEVQSDSDLGSLEILSDTIVYEDARNDLLRLALVEKTEGTGQLSVHRLVQLEFQYFLHQRDSEARQRAFDNASELLHLVFPRQTKGRPMHDDWGTCQLYQAHVISLTQHYLSRSKGLLELKANPNFCELVSNCAWYLRERNARELDTVLIAGLQACRSLGSSEQHELTLAHICNTAGAWKDDQGYFKEAVDHFLECYRLRKKYLPEADDDISGVLHNISLNFLNARKYKECLDYRQQSVNSIELMPPSSVRDTKAAKREYVLGRCLMYQGYYHESEEVFRRALDAVEERNWFPRALTLNALGNLKLRLRLYPEAQSWFQKAEDCVETAQVGSEFSVTLGTLYFQARTALYRQDPRRSFERLLKLLNLMNEGAALEVERARAYWKLGQALQALPALEPQEKKNLEADLGVSLEPAWLLEQARKILNARCPEANWDGQFTDDNFVGLVHDPHI